MNAFLPPSEHARENGGPVPPVPQFSSASARCPGICPLHADGTRHEKDFGVRLDAQYAQRSDKTFGAPCLAAEKLTAVPGRGARRGG